MKQEQLEQEVKELKSTVEKLSRRFSEAPHTSSQKPTGGYKSQKTYEDVYVATVTKDNKVFLQDRNYGIIAEIPVGKTAGFLVEGACVCQIQKNWFGQPYKPVESESYWFCLDRNTNKRATAEISGDGDKQVTMRQPGSSCGE